ncbi:MAG TPA: PAS domain S-box protein, partial [Stellaceae bacterium]|nr:PAS domain S-box protein [Stellaceae bacterium]
MVEERERERLQVLHRLEILDTEPEEAFDRVTDIAARFFQTPKATVTFVDRERQWFKSRIGIEVRETPRDIAFCSHTIRTDQVCLVPDATRDPRFTDNPLVTSGMVRFYAGAPLITRDGYRVGALCIIDSIPRHDINASDLIYLERLANVVMDELELRAAKRLLMDELASRTLAESRLKLLNDLTETALAAADFNAAMRACLALVARHVRADYALAFGMAANSAICRLEAEYVAEDGVPEGFPEIVHRFPLRADNTITGEAVTSQRVIAIRDVHDIDSQRFPLMNPTQEYGFTSFLSVPFENAGTKFGLTFLFRKRQDALDTIAETVHGLSGKLRDLLARKRAEEHIALLQSVVLHANDAVMIIEAASREGGMRVVFVNRSFTELTHYREEEVVGQTLKFLLGPRSDVQVIRRIDRAFERFEPARAEFINYRKDGSEIWVDVALAPVADASGHYTHWIGILRETTQRREAEEALKRLSLRQSAILDALPAHVALLDGEGRVLSVSRSWHEFAAGCGLLSAPVGRLYFDLCQTPAWAEEGAAIAAGLTSVLQGRSPHFSIDHPSDRDGRRSWYHLIVAPITTPETQGAVVMHLDVTSSKLAEEALRREKEFSEFLIKSSTEGIFVFDRYFRVSLWNPGIETITGMATERILTRSLFEALPSLTDSAAAEAMRAALSGRESSLYDQRYLIPETNREGYYEAYFAPLYSRGREVIGGIGFWREVTERRRIEDALRQSQKMEAVGQLTGGIAHDFNNMLTVIAGNLELLEGRLQEEPRLLRFVDSAALATSRAEKLTQQLLTFSRRQQLRPQPIDFNQIILGMDDLVHRTVGETIEIRKVLSPELWFALADPNQIETSLLNLVLNARDAMPQGGHITIETGNMEISAGEG